MRKYLDLIRFYSDVVPYCLPQTMLTAISMSAIATNGVVPGKTLW